MELSDIQTWPAAKLVALVTDPDAPVSEAH